MISPRWRKVLRDLWGNKTRTLLVVLSISIGVAAIGVIAGTNAVITRELPASYAGVNPASATISTAPFDDELLRVIRSLPGVQAAEGRFNLFGRLKVGEDWRDIWISVLPNFDGIHINKIWSQSGAWPPAERALLIERSTLRMAGADVGETVLIQTENGLRRELRIDGLVHDLNSAPGTFSNQINGYITLDTLEWLGFPRSFNEMLLVVDPDPGAGQSVQSVVKQVEGKIEKSGRPVYWTLIPESGKHWFETFLTPMTYILAVLGGVVLLLSAFLVINTVSSALAQQVRQIGIMKAVGARTPQLLMMYLVSMLIVGAFSLGVAVPAGAYGTQACVRLVASIMNFDIQRMDVPAQIYQLQFALSILVPVIAAVVPILLNTRVTVREAISDYGLSRVNFGDSLFDRLLGRVRGLPRPLMLSLRNTFRRKIRLVLTLTTLTLGSAIFIGVLSVYASLLKTLDEALEYYGFDVVVNFSHPYRVDQILNEINQVPGVVAAETWGVTTPRILGMDGNESKNIIMVAPPTHTRLINPTVIQGRWLLPEDENAIVVNTDVLRENPHLRVGDDAVLKIDGDESTWRIVGVVRSVLIGPWAYTNYPYFSRLLGRLDQADAVYVLAEGHDPQTQTRMAKALEEHFEGAGIRVSSTGRVYELRAAAVQQFNVVILFLLAMSFILTFVGGLGLMGTMSLNVFERTREIGVMRAIGASNGSIMQIVIVEGVITGLLSWVTGSLLALPISNLMSDTIGRDFLNAPLSKTFSTNGAILWLGIIVFLAVLASFLPARHATRLTVRDVLTYE